MIKAERVRVWNDELTEEQNEAVNKVIEDVDNRGKWLKESCRFWARAYKVDERWLLQYSKIALKGIWKCER